MFNNVSTFARRHIALITISIILLILIIIFHEIMQPFVIALIVVYLIDPFVALVHKINIKGHHLPRGVAVISAYIIFLGAVTGVCIALIPTLTKEISAATEAMPHYYNQIKNEELPKWSHKLDELVFELSRTKSTDVESSVVQTSTIVNNAFDNAMKHTDTLNIPVIDTTGTQPLLRAERIVKTKPQKADSTPEIAKTPVLFTLHQTEDGYYEFRQGSEEILIQPNDKGAYIIKTQDAHHKDEHTSIFNLEQELTKTITEFVESSTEYIGNALSFLQYIIEFIVDTFIQVILVFMLAAFISIDSPKLMASVRTLFEDAKGNAAYFDAYKERLSKALAGVIRGQIIICMINGSLTGLALWIFGIDYALLLGIIAGVLSIVPVFGTIISTIPCVLLALMQGWWQAIGVLACILGIHFVDTNFFTPKIIGASANLHPAVIIFAILAGQYIAGTLGLVLALPVTAVFITTVKFFLEQAKKSDAEAENQNKLALATTANVSTLTLPASGIAQAVTTPTDTELPQPLPIVPLQPVVPSQPNIPASINQIIEPVQPQQIPTAQHIQTIEQTTSEKKELQPPSWMQPQNNRHAHTAHPSNSSNTSTPKQQSVKSPTASPVQIPENAKDTDTMVMQNMDSEVFTNITPAVPQPLVQENTQITETTQVTKNTANHHSKQNIIHKANK